MRSASVLLALALFACSKPPPPAAPPPAPKPEPTPAAAPGPVEHSACGAAITAPVAYQSRGVRDEDEELHLEAPDGAEISVSCAQKEDLAAGDLVFQAQNVLRQKLLAGVARDRIHFANGEEEPVDRHPVIGLEIALDDTAARYAYLFTERARAVYWIRIAAPADTWAAHAGERRAILRSFRVVDAQADVGPTRFWHRPIDEDTRTLTAARAAFHTKVRKGRPAAFDGKPAPAPPRGVFDKVNVRGPAGRLTAYVTPNPKDGKKHPAVVWAHGGFGGIDAWFWENAPRSNDQSARAFRDAGIVLAVGSWRAENDNPGDFELYYGEVDDYLAIRDYVAKLPFVDPARIYLAGHSSGGALVLLAAEKSDAFRAAFSIGGVPIAEDSKTYASYGGVPFDAAVDGELALRSAAPFVASIRRPTFYVEGGGSAWAGLAQWMGDRAAEHKTPFSAYLALQANHFSLVAPLTELIAKKIVADTGPETTIRFSQQEIDALQVADDD